MLLSKIPQGEQEDYPVPAATKWETTDNKIMNNNH